MSSSLTTETFWNHHWILMSLMSFHCSGSVYRVKALQETQWFIAWYQQPTSNWWDHIINAEILQKTGLSTITKILRNRRLSLFGHVARLDPEVPANKALLLMVNSHEGRKPSTSWTVPAGRPRRTWLNLVQEDANAIPLSSLWRTEIFRGYGAAQRSVRTMR